MRKSRSFTHTVFEEIIQMITTWEHLSNDISDAVGAVGRSVVAVDGRSGHTSSGILLRENVVVTAAHCLRTDNAIRVISGPGESVGARLAGRDRGTDVAVLVLDREIDFQPAAFGKTDDLAVGQLVVAVARTRRGNLVASAGLISGLMGEWRVARTRIDRFIRPDLELYSGFSGGALIGSGGTAIGMNTSRLLRGKPITIPASTLTRVAEELLARGHVEQAYIGLVMHPVSIPESLRDQAGVQTGTGLLVMQVAEGGPAEAAGVLLGDILVAADGRLFEELDELNDTLDRRGAGEKVGISVIRGGQEVGLEVRIGTRPLR
jgi:serine protease Do